jgi:hypothetical protein
MLQYRTYPPKRFTWKQNLQFFTGLFVLGAIAFSILAMQGNLDIRQQAQVYDNQSAPSSDTPSQPTQQNTDNSQNTQVATQELCMQCPSYIDPNGETKGPVGLDQYVMSNEGCRRCAQFGPNCLLIPADQVLCLPEEQQPDCTVCVQGKDINGNINVETPVGGRLQGLEGCYECRKKSKALCRYEKIANSCEQPNEPVTSCNSCDAYLAPDGSVQGPVEIDEYVVSNLGCVQCIKNTLGCGFASRNDSLCADVAVKTADTSESNQGGMLSRIFSAPTQRNSNVGVPSNEEFVTFDFSQSQQPDIAVTVVKLLNQIIGLD